MITGSQNIQLGYLKEKKFKHDFAEHLPFDVIKKKILITFTIIKVTYNKQSKQVIKNKTEK